VANVTAGGPDGRHRRRSPPVDYYSGEASDEALVAGMASGDDRATVAFVRRFQRRVYGMAIGVLADRAAAEDVAQEAMLRAWRHAPIFDPRRGSVENWVLTIARNLSIDALRARRSVPTDPDELVDLASATQVKLDANSIKDPAAFAQFQKAQDGLSSALSRLMVVAEAYPELKANQNFRDLQAQLEGSENRITVERQRFNEAAQAFNTKRQTFPTVMIAGFFGDKFREKAYFKAQEGAETAPKVKF